jgi:hypothetical protein
MTRDSTTRLEDRDRQRILSSPVARAFVRIVTQRRGITEAQAEQAYLDYINRVEPADSRRRREVA